MKGHKSINTKLSSAIPNLFADIDKANSNLNQEDESVEFVDENSLLKGIRFCLMGKFTIPMKTIQQKIIDAGGSKKMGLSKKTRVIVLGKNPSEKDLSKLEILNHDGFIFPFITEDNLLDILNRKNKVFNFPEVIKNVDITYDFIFNSKFPKIIQISKDGITHILGGKEIFVYNTSGNYLLFGQIMGNIASVVVNRFDPSSTNYIMLNNTTIAQLKKGIKDDVIQLITETYNNSKHDKFTYKFILETQILEFIKNRSSLIDDKITTELTNKYINQK